MVVHLYDKCDYAGIGETNLDFRLLGLLKPKIIATNKYDNF